MNSLTTHRLLLPLLIIVGVAGTLLYYLPHQEPHSSVTKAPKANVTAAVALLPNIQVSSNFTPITAWPVSTNALDYLGDLDSPVLGNVNYLANAQDGQIITSFRVDNSSPLASYSPSSALQTLYTTYKTANPNTLIGSYVSGADCLYAAAVRHYYSNAVTCEAILAAAGNPKDALLPYQGIPNELRRRVNLANVAVRKAFINLLVDEGITRGLPFLYLDNIAHPSTGAFRNTKITFADQLDLITQVRTNLEARGIRAVFNIALSPAGLTGQYADDVNKLRAAAGQGGYSFEMPLHPNIRNKAGDIAREISVFRQWLNAGELILLVPAFTWTSLGERLADLQLVAAYGMMVKLERDSPLFVSRLGYWLAPEEFSWRDWPARLGDPVGDYRFTSLDPVIMQRRFANGTLEIKPASRRVSIDFYSHITTKELTELVAEGTKIFTSDEDRGLEEVVTSAGQGPANNPSAPISPSITPERASDLATELVVAMPNKDLSISFGGGGQNVVTATAVGGLITSTTASANVQAAVEKISSILTDLIVYLQTSKKGGQKPDYVKVNRLLEQIIKVLVEVKRYTK